MARYPRITLPGGHDTSCASIATLPSNPDHGLVVFVEDLNQCVAYDAEDEVWYALGPIQKAGAPTDGASGTGVGVIFTGALCINTLTGDLFGNVGSSTSPIWTHFRSAYSTV